MKIPRICISSASGSGGKTLFSLGLGRALGNTRIKPFKKGPDYIDAAWLTAACGNHATNLDLFFMEPYKLSSFFATSMQGYDFALIEGNRGLFDGLDIHGKCSTASLARTLACPILLCLDCSKSTRTMAAILNGLTSFEKDLNFCGVILNKVGSSRHENSLVAAIREYSSLPVLGTIPRLAENPLPERHMGLVCHSEDYEEKVDKKLSMLGELVLQNCNIKEIINLCEQNAEFAGKREDHEKTNAETHPVRIGYICDKAFWFYYPENLTALEVAGAELVRLSLFDRGEENKNNWDSIRGLYIGGGFPEEFCMEITASPYTRQIGAYAESGMPIYAECGGLILLGSSLEREGQAWKMAGVLNSTSFWNSTPQGLGYVEARVISENPFFPVGMKIKGHEFHYTNCTMQNGKYCLELQRGKGIYKNIQNYDGVCYKNVWASYTHIFAPCLPCWAENFVRSAEKYA